MMGQLQSCTGFEGSVLCPTFFSLSLIAFIADCEIFQELMQDILTNARFLSSPVEGSNSRIKDT